MGTYRLAASVLHLGHGPTQPEEPERGEVADELPEMAKTRRSETNVRL